MPRPRLPWFKLWVGTSRNSKIVSLPDRVFRVWIELLDAASEQKVRGRFLSYANAASIIRRKDAEVRLVAAAGLMDEDADGVWMHDWSDWQRWRPEDDGAIDTGSTRESHTNNTRITPEKHTKTRRLARAREDVDVDVDVEGEGDKERESPSGAKAPSPPQAGKGRRVTVVDDDFESALEDEFYEAFGSRQAVRDVIAHAMSHKARAKCTDQRAYLRNWVRDDAQKSAQRRGKRQPVVVDQLERPVEIRPPRSCKQCGKACYLNSDRCGACRKTDAEKGAA